jgi:hypothetical protein
MTSKVPTAEEVLALVSAAAATPSEPTMQQILLQVQQAQLLQHQQHQQSQQAADAEAAAAAMGMGMGMASMHATASGDADAAMELMNAVNVEAASMAASMAAAAAASTTTATTAAVGTPPSTAGDPASTSDASAVGSSSSSAIRRKSIPLSMKKQAIEWILGPGKGVPSRAEKHFSALNWDVSASSFRKWWKNRDKIMNDASTKKRISGGGRKPYLEESEERLLVIVIQERAKKDRVTRKWIAKTAQHMFQRTNASFKASENWVTKFIRRNGLTLKRSYVTYDHAAAETGALANGVSAATTAQALALAAGAIEVHEDDDDDMDDDDMNDEPEGQSGGGAAGTAAAQQAADAYVSFGLCIHSPILTLCVGVACCLQNSRLGLLVLWASTNEAMAGSYFNTGTGKSNVYVLKELE